MKLRSRKLRPSAKNPKWLFVFAVALIIFCLAARILPHVPNFAPLGALAIFGGVYFNWAWSLAVPFVTLAFSDLVLGLYDWRLMAAVYGAWLLGAAAGWVIKKQPSVFNIGVSVLISATVFFLITNFAVWAFSSWYPHTLGGLIAALLMGLPFFKATILSNFFYSGLFFGAAALLHAYTQKPSRSRRVQPVALIHKRLL